MTPMIRRTDIRVLLFKAQSFQLHLKGSRADITFSKNQAIRSYQEERREFKHLLHALKNKNGSIIHNAIASGKYFATLWQLFSPLP